MTPTQLEAILAERETCAEVAGKLVRFDRKGADAQQRTRADSFQSGQRYAAEQIRNRPTPASEEVEEVGRDNIRAAIANAFVAGCQAVHENHQEDRDPDFSEAASDYASDAMSVFDMFHPSALARP